MRILAIETTDIAGSVALFEADQLIAGSDLDPQLRSAQSLAPGIAALLQNAGWQPKQVQLVAVAVGPGSFTGLRVGISTAKLFAYAIGAEVMGVNTLEVIAAQAPAEISALWAVLDAQRAQVFAGRFQREAVSSWRWDRHVALIDNTAWLASLSPGEAVSGPVLEKLKEQIPSGV
ncbi:MAG TPA: tRNA (adenosine(37)-N6)-threonylcarbamoyltransferase complex dimerization subunit type 1 TsaB, partial [Pirellulales bacterium]